VCGLVRVCGCGAAACVYARREYKQPKGLWLWWLPRCSREHYKIRTLCASTPAYCSYGIDTTYYGRTCKLKNMGSAHSLGPWGGQLYTTSSRSRRVRRTKFLGSTLACAANHGECAHCAVIYSPRRRELVVYHGAVSSDTWG
jgi:hypothetical protein